MIDLDRYVSFRRLFSILDTPKLNRNKYSQLYTFCKQKQDEIKLQCEYATQEAKAYLPQQVIEHILCVYI